MRFFLLLFSLFSYIYTCDKSSNTAAYKEYTNNKQLYIDSIMSNDKNQKLSSLKKIIDCGEFLGFNVDSYKKRFSELSKTTPKIDNRYELKLISMKPLKLKLSSNSKVNYFKLDGEYKKKVLDISNVHIKNKFSKTIDNISIKIANYKNNIVRVVLYSKNDFQFLYSVKNGYLIVSYWNNKKYTKPINKKVESKNIIKDKNKKKLKIVIDAGHGGKDPGGVGYKKRQEKIITLAVAKYLNYELIKRGYSVYMTRKNDKFITLRNRTRYANNKKGDLFLSLHCNVSPKTSKTRGIETYFLSPARTERAKRVAKLENSAIGNLHSSLTQSVILNFLNRKKIIQSEKLSIDIQKNILYSLRKKYKYINDGGVREAPFWVLVGTQMPAILVELGYLTNSLESTRLISKNYQKLLAKGIADGIDAYFRKNN
jgi:N-acetylmuramoyl-L-alanine amidase